MAAGLFLICGQKVKCICQIDGQFCGIVSPGLLFRGIVQLNNESAELVKWT